MHSKGKKLIAVAALTAVYCASGADVSAAVIDFEDRQRGEIVDDQYAGFQGGVFVSANNNDPSGPDVAAIFVADPNFVEPDPDLRPPYTRGNIKGTSPGKVLIIPENATDVGSPPPGQGPNGLIDFPNDEASGGWIQFRFGQQIESLGFDFLDAEGITRDFANGYSVQFYQDRLFVGQVTFRRFMNENSQFYDPTIEFGDDSINRIEPIRADQLGLGVTSFNRVVFNLGESGALDRIDFVVIPEPGTAAMALLGLAGVHFATGRSRRRR